MKSDDNQKRDLGEAKITYKKPTAVWGHLERDDEFFYVTTNQGTTAINKNDVLLVEPIELYRGR